MQSSDPSFLRAVEPALGELLPGCTVVDRDLDVEGGPSADLVCVDEEGRLHLLMHVEGGAEETVLRALDAVAFTQRHAPILAAHCAGDAANSNLTPRIVLLGRHFAERAIGRLAPLIEEHDPTLLVFEVRTIHSTGREGAWFAPILSGSSSGAVIRITLSQFLAELPDSLEPLASELIERLEHLDPELRTEVLRARVKWRLGDGELCQLAHTSSGLVVSVPEHDDVELPDRSRLEPALEAIMNRYLKLLGADPETALLEDDVEDDLIPSAQPNVVLTQEELDAFHQP